MKLIVFRRACLACDPRLSPVSVGADGQPLSLLTGFNLHSGRLLGGIWFWATPRGERRGKTRRVEPLTQASHGGECLGTSPPNRQPPHSYHHTGSKQRATFNPHSGRLLGWTHHLQPGLQARHLNPIAAFCGNIRMSPMTSIRVSAHRFSSNRSPQTRLFFKVAPLCGWGWLFGRGIFFESSRGANPLEKYRSCLAAKLDFLVPRFGAWDPCLKKKPYSSPRHHPWGW